MNPTKDDNSIYIDFDRNHILIKGDKEDRSICYIEASNEDFDSDQEVVLKKALEAQTENYLKNGVISWDHLHKLKKHNQYIIGEPLDVRFTDENKTLVKAKLYEKNEHAKALMDNLESGSTRYGASIGGNVVTKSKQFRKAIGKSIPVISKLIWDETAITHKPVNSGTRGGVTYAKYKEFNKSFMFSTSLMKALTAGNGVNPANFASGRALIPEAGKQKKFWLDIITALKSKEVDSYESLKDFLQKSYSISDEGEQQAIAHFIINKYL